MKRRFAVLGAALATAAALVVLVGSTAFAQVPGGYGYGPGGYGNGYGMMGGYYGGSGYYGPQSQAPNGTQGYYHGWGCGGWDW
ncbi:MAG: hypothetical protein M1370_11410 [Bacteroidetes bacterium]|nr:hypothetical protein [Bacteroidota bacterium]